MTGYTLPDQKKGVGGGRDDITGSDFNLGDTAVCPSSPNHSAKRGERA